MNQYETSRLSVRPLRASDVSDIYEYAQLATVGQLAGFIPVNTPAEASLFIATLQKQGIFAIELKATQKVVGNIGLYEVINADQEPSLTVKEIGYALNPKYQNQGIMTEAVQGLLAATTDNKLERVVGVTTADNTASSKVLEKSNFKFIGKREVPSVFSPTELITEMVYAIDLK